jgi:hypothetical protein
MKSENDLNFECCQYQCKAIYECSSDGFYLQDVEVYDGEDVIDADNPSNIAELLRKEDIETFKEIWRTAEKKVASEYADYADHLNEWYADQAADYEREQQGE